MAVVKGKLKPRRHVPCCLSPPTLTPSWKCSLPFAVHSYSPWPSLIAMTSALMLMGFRYAGQRQHVQKVVMEQSPLYLRDATYLQPEPQDWGTPLTPNQNILSNSFIGLLPHCLFSPLPKHPGSRAHALNVLSWSVLCEFYSKGPQIGGLGCSLEMGCPGSSDEQQGLKSSAVERNRLHASRGKQVSEI